MLFEWELGVITDNVDINQERLLRKTITEPQTRI